MAAVMPLEMLNRQLEINSCLSRTEISAGESVHGCENVAVKMDTTYKEKNMGLHVKP